MRTITGPVFTEVIQSFTGWGSASLTQPGPKELTQTTRLTAGDSDVVMVSHGIPVIPMDRELISRINTDLESDTVWTDDTGLELYPRKLNSSLPISGSYKSLVNSAVLKADDGKRALSVLTRHTMGVAVLAPSELEYMMMRRISGTDDQGPWPLNETTPITVHTALLAGRGATVERLRLIRALEQENQPAVMYHQIATAAADRSDAAPKLGKLPAGVHMLSFVVRMPRDDESAPPTEVVIQLQNIIEHNTPTVLAGGIAALLPWASLDTCTETTLTLQQPLAQNRRLVWRANDGTTSGTTPVAVDDCTVAIEVGPLDIRSFVVVLKSDGE